MGPRGFEVIEGFSATIFKNNCDIFVALAFLDVSYHMQVCGALVFTCHFPSSKATRGNLNVMCKGFA